MKQSKTTDASGGVWVPQAAMDWLNGAGPDHEGKWFGETDLQMGRGAYQWRNRFRDMIAALASAPPAPTPEAGVSAEAIEAASAAYYDGMTGTAEERWPHHTGWAGKTEAFKEKVRAHMARALTAAITFSASGQTWRITDETATTAHDGPCRMWISRKTGRARFFPDGLDPNTDEHFPSPPPAEDLARQGEPVAWAFEWMNRGGWVEGISRTNPGSLGTRNVEPLFRRSASASRPAGDLAGQGEPVAWAYECLDVDVWVPRVALDEPKPRAWIRNIRPLYAAPAPSRPADREEIARAMCRHQIAVNRSLWGRDEPMADESLRRAEDNGWQQWAGFADAVFECLTHPDREGKGGERP